MSNFISLDQAIAMTTRYRANNETVLAPQFQKQGLLPICETFEGASFTTLLNEPGCVAIRVYLGMDETLNVRVIAVGVNEKNEDMLPAKTGATAADGGGNIVEDGIRCPDICPPKSDLNS